MYFILSPAKRMKLIQQPAPLGSPACKAKTAALYQALSRCTPWELESVLRVSPQLAEQAFTLYLNWEDSPDSPAVLAYQGLAYQYMQPEAFTTEMQRFAHEHLWIFSAFYGPLKAMDAIRPYRLEMVSRILMDGQNLYRYWGDSFYEEVFRAGRPVLNLASGEYTKCVAPFVQAYDQLVQCDFLQYYKGRLTTLAAPAKMARGKMAAYIIRNQIEALEEVKNFDELGYRCNRAACTPNKLVFVQQPCSV